jgi:hypothetical protein
MRLYVKSQKTDVVSYDAVPGGSAIADRCAAGYVSRSVLSGYRPEEEKALTILRGKGVKFSLVDLSMCPFVTRLRARVTGIKKTPTLVLDDGNKIEGINRIKDYIDEKLVAAQAPR